MTDQPDGSRAPAPRFHYARAAEGGYKALLGLEEYLESCGLEAGLIPLVKLRVSQINGCAFCIDVYWRELREHGETEQRLYTLDAWHESPFYSDRERAALAWAEAVTQLADGHVPDEVYRQVRAQFDEPGVANLTFAVAAINAWNRLVIASRTPPGGYQPPKSGRHG